MRLDVILTGPSSDEGGIRPHLHWRRLVRRASLRAKLKCAPGMRVRSGSKLRDPFEVDRRCSICKSFRHVASRMVQRSAPGHLGRGWARVLLGNGATW